MSIPLTFSSSSSIVTPPPPSQRATCSPSSSGERKPALPHMTHDRVEDPSRSRGGSVGTPCDGAWPFFPPRLRCLRPSPPPVPASPPAPCVVFAVNSELSSDSMRSMSGENAAPLSSTNPVMDRTSSRKNSCTGNVRPGMLISAGLDEPRAPMSMSMSMSASARPPPVPLQYLTNSSVCIVALIRITLTSSLLLNKSLNATIRNSVYLSRSWTSSIIITLNSSNSGDDCTRRNSTPGVTNRSWVASDIAPSRRTLYPTVPPAPLSHRSDETRSATDMADMRRGCVITTDAVGPIRGSSRRNWGTWVDLPQPVSPLRTVTREESTASQMEVAWE
mmetsp:Transcript_24886/g.50585  ORF Transcript_24886/g.50585 Transcript_24886/m.50585 type:complete len:333 (+) Transcript_24886:1984-2982(+)